jgi:peptide/nickel transport system permease protein
MAEPATELTAYDSAALIAAEEHGVPIVGRSPWYLAWRRLRRNYFALVCLGVFFAIVIACALAPVYAHHVAHTGPNVEHSGETVMVNGHPTPVISGGSYYDAATGKFVIRDVKIIGPTWWHANGRFVLGADSLGRDVAVRLLYGGLNSLKIGIGSAFICTIFAVLLALLGGFYGGWPDWTIARFFDLIWAFPVFLLAIALGSALSINGFHHFGINIEAGSLWIPTLVISYVLIPYIGRPVRGQILSLREKEFIEAAIGQGAKPWRVMLSDLLPNIASTVLVFFTLIIASNILTETGLSFLGAGVRPPDPSWGNLIADGQDHLRTAPWLALIPGLAIVLTVLSLNIFGDGLRDALDPRAKVRIEH